MKMVLRLAIPPLAAMRHASFATTSRRRSRTTTTTAPQTLKSQEEDISKKKAWPTWRRVNAGELGISKESLSLATRTVLNQLKKRGYEVYLVGGCVRDLIMKRTPKDFDIITTADLREVQKVFRRCDIVGKRFPICLVYLCSTVVEVSSFKTSVRKPNVNLRFFTRMPVCDEDDYARCINSIGRDFTVNGLMLDPFSKKVYDYLGGMNDIKKAKIRTVISPKVSFQEDCARILRAIRIAARLGFSFSRDTAIGLRDLASSVVRLDKTRIQMELNYMLAYGSAEASLRLLWRFAILDLLLPIQAAYFISQDFRRRENRTNLLLVLFSELDKLLAPDKPCDSCLWIGILAFHLALTHKPRDPLVIATFALALLNGGDMLQAVYSAKCIKHPHNASFPELLALRGYEKDEDLVDEVTDLAISTGAALSSMMDGNKVSKAMAKYTETPSNFVFMAVQAYWKVSKIFECIQPGERKRGNEPKYTHRINYINLSSGGLADIRYAFAKVVLYTVFPPNLGKENAQVVSEDQM